MKGKKQRLCVSVHFVEKLNLLSAIRELFIE
jgi:hypothetical protein